MIKHWIFILGILFWSVPQGAQAQNGRVTTQIYLVRQGDELTQLINRFKSCRAEILSLNPELSTSAKLSLEPGQSLVMPALTEDKEQAHEIQAFTQHKVRRKETLFGIARSYGISVMDIQAYNSGVTQETLEKGDRLRIYTGCNPLDQKQVGLIRQDLSDQMRSWHVIKAKETLWNIAYRYDMSIQELQELNPNLTQNLTIGQRIKLRGMALDSEVLDDPNFDYYQVQRREGFYRLRQKFGLTKDQIVKLNPNAAQGLKLGMVLRLPKQVLTSMETEQEAIVDLRNFIQDSSAQKITVMLPLQLEGFIPESLYLNQEYLQNNRLLCIALDFYSGVLMAKDHAISYGLPVTLDVLDTQAKRSVVDSILEVYDFDQSDMVLGPLLPNNVRSVAEHLARKDIPVIAPLSRLSGRIPDNLVQTIPDAKPMRRALMDCFKGQKQDREMLFLGDAQAPGLAAMRGEWPEVKVLFPREQGYIDPDDILPHLSDSLDNWVLLESRNPVIISNVIGVLNGMEYYQLKKRLKKRKRKERDAIPKTYSVRLFTTDKNEAFEFDDISNNHLSHLEFSFPSMSKPLNLDGPPNLFVQGYLERFGTTPNKYATRGYDLTLDLILRQAASEESLTDILIMPEATQYTENKFRYELGPDGGFDNQAFYLLHYTQEMRLEELINSLGAQD